MYEPIYSQALKVHLASHTTNSSGMRGYMYTSYYDIVSQCWFLD